MNHVISLTTATERRKHIIREFGKHGIEFEFFDAITPDLIDDVCQKLTIDLNQNQRLSQGEKACFLSHVCLWQKMIDENTPYTVIFEDDVILSEDINQFLDKNFISLCQHFDIIKLETFFEKTHLKYESTHKNRTINQLKSPHMGASGYIISQQGAKYLLENIKNTPIHQMMAIDHVIFEMFIKQLNIHQINPAVCVQTMFLDKTSLPSQLEHYRQNNAHESKFDDDFIQKIHRTFNRLKRSIGKRTVYQKVDFR